MANTAQAKKRARQNEKRSLQKTSQRSSVRTAIKNVLKHLAASDQKAAEDAYREAATILDRAAGRDLVHRNKAARLKSRLNKKLKDKASS